MPAYAADYITKVPHTFTARVGTTEFTKDGAAQPLDVAIYTKNGYTMLPLRTFMKAALGEKSQMAWDNETKAATVAFGGNLIRFSIKENTIAKNGKDLPVWGKMEVKDGRVFVPLRNLSLIHIFISFSPKCFVEPNEECNRIMNWIAEVDVWYGIC